MGFIQKIFDKQKEKKQSKLNKEEFFSLLIEAASDGKLTNEEIETLNENATMYGLTEADINKIRMQAYNTAFLAIKRDGKITEEEEIELNKIQKYLKIPDEEIVNSKKELAKFRILNEIQNGILPTTIVPNLVLQKNETAHWKENACILENKVIRRRYEGGSRGVSIRLAKGLSYRVGGHRGQILTDTALIAVSQGELVLTNKRIIFKGDSKSLNMKLDKVLNFEFFSDGINITESSVKSRLLKLDNPKNIDLIGAILSTTINNYT